LPMLTRILAQMTLACKAVARALSTVWPSSRHACPFQGYNVGAVGVYDIDLPVVVGNWTIAIRDQTLVITRACGNAPPSADLAAALQMRPFWVDRPRDLRYTEQGDVVWLAVFRNHVQGGGIYD
jgi:hypothetical protein